MAAEFHVFAGRITVPTGGYGFVVTEDPGGTPSQFTATIPAGTYYVYGLGAESGDLLKAIKDQLEAGSPNGAAYDVGYTGKITPDGVTGAISITIDQLGFRIDGTNGSHTFPMALIGLADSTDYTDTALEIASVLSPSHTWCSNQPVTRLDPLSTDKPIAQHVSRSGEVHTVTGGARTFMRRFAFRYVNDDRVWRDYSSADEARTFEAWLENVDDGCPVRVYKDTESSTAGDLEALSSADLVDTVIPKPFARFAPERESAGGLPLFRWAFDAQREV